MTIIERLKLELSHKDYFEDNDLIIFLSENSLLPLDLYVKETMQRYLLLTVIDIFEAVSNDVDLMRTVADATTGLTINDAYKLMQSRIQDIRSKVSTISALEDTTEYSNVSLLFTKGRR